MGGKEGKNARLSALYLVTGLAGHGRVGKSLPVGTPSFVPIPEGGIQFLELFYPAGEAPPEFLILRVCPDPVEWFVEDISENYLCSLKFSAVKNPFKGGRERWIEVNARGDFSFDRYV